MSSLPPGVTDQMIDDRANGPPCLDCGHYSADHYEEGDELLDSDGKVVSACDIIKCNCTKFKDWFI